MNFKSVLTEDHSLSLMLRIAKHVGHDQSRFDELMKLSLSGDTILAPRASWAAMHAGEKKPQLIYKWISKMIRFLQSDSNSSVKRNFLRLLQDAEIPVKYRGEMFETGFQLLRSVKEPIAVKAFGMTVLTNIVCLHPELKNEMEILIRDLMGPEAPPALISRGKKSLKTLSKIHL